MAQSSIQYAIISSGDPRYEAALRLRKHLLRDPLGLVFTQEELLADRSADHIIAENNGQIVGCATGILYSDRVKVRQMAVAEEWQRQGIGRILLLTLEQYFLSRGMDHFILHAREDIAVFYVQCGYKIYGEPFIQVGLPHRAMEKKISVR